MGKEITKLLFEVRGYNPGGGRLVLRFGLDNPYLIVILAEKDTHF